MANFNYNKIIVHGSVFHADDVFCVAMAQVINPWIKVERLNRITEDDIADDTIICDIGFGKYDHHQEDAELHDDGRKFSAATLFFRDFSSCLFTDEEYVEGFYNRYLRPIEDADNGVAENPLTSAIGAFNPTWNEDDAENNMFFSAVAFVKQIIYNAIRSNVANNKAKVLVTEALEKEEDGICILEQYLPSHLFIGSDAKFLISPSNRSGYQLLTVKKELGSFEDVQSLPSEWLEQPPTGCTFVHQARFIASFDTEENAIAAAKSI